MSKKPIKTDLARLDRMKDTDIDYSDIPALDNSFFTKPTVQWALKRPPKAVGKKQSDKG